MENKKSFATRVYEMLNIEEENVNADDIIITIDMKECYAQRHFFPENYIEHYINELIKKIQKETRQNLSDEEKNIQIKKIVRKIFFDILTLNDDWDKEFKILYDIRKNKIKIPILPEGNENEQNNRYGEEVGIYVEKEKFVKDTITNINKNYMNYIKDFYKELLKKGLEILPQDQQYFTRINRVLDEYLEMSETTEKKQTR